jgi:hypothetical protein
MVAWKVHIQSGGFSFSFRHRKGDSGMGMISPLWEETDDVLHRPLTRITLLLHEEGPGKPLAGQKESILQQFHELKATFLLFMRNLRKIEVSIYDESDNKVCHTTLSVQSWEQERVAINEEIVENGNTKRVTHHYRTTKLTASNIPRSEKREYTEAEIAANPYDQTDIILAFPLTPDSVPIIQPQEVFACLPIQNMGLPVSRTLSDCHPCLTRVQFLVQADFVTDASRQDIVRSSARNISLLPAIASTFTLAVKQFCAHRDLAYQWMRYLPDINWGAEDSFWKQLPDMIRRQLQLTNTLWTRSRGQMGCIAHMRLVPSDMCDKSGTPLLPDLFLGQYLSSRYALEDLRSLQKYGLRWVTESQFIARLQQDVKNGDSSVMRNPGTDDDWHSAVARYLIGVSKTTDEATLKLLKNIELIPLIGGRWVSPATLGQQTVYFTHTSGYALPTDDIFNLVTPSAQANSIRKQLFAVLGVEEISLASARLCIIIGDSQRLSGLQASRSHLHFLYRTAHLDSRDNDPSSSMALNLIDTSNEHRSWKKAPWYFPDGGPYGAEQLLAQFDRKPSILHPFYMEDCPEKPDKEIRSWGAWLAQTFNIRHAIPLTRSGRLSDECLHVAQSCQDRFLSFLLKYWQREKANILSKASLVKALLEIKVPCQNGRSYPLGKTYVRTPQLEYADRFFENGEPFPWLKLDFDQAAELPEIGVLTTALGFGYPESDLEFHLEILRLVVDSNKETKATLNVARLLEIYSGIAAIHYGNAPRDKSRNIIVLVFHQLLRCTSF